MQSMLSRYWIFSIVFLIFHAADKSAVTRGKLLVRVLLKNRVITVTLSRLPLRQSQTACNAILVFH